MPEKNPVNGKKTTDNTSLKPFGSISMSNSLRVSSIRYFSGRAVLKKHLTFVGRGMDMDSKSMFLI